MNERDTLKINAKSHLQIGGLDCTEIAEKYGTPVYVFDETHIRNMMRVYKNVIDKEYGGNGLVAYASKAFSCKAVYAIAHSENIGVDVVSGGELYTAISAGFPADKIIMHGNNKLLNELQSAVDSRIGLIVVDSFNEADILDKLCAERNISQNVLIRINPGIEAHTHAFVQTARTDSKFGFSISDGTAEKMTNHVLSKSNLVLKGYHCHIGSQIFEKQSFVLAVGKVMDFVAYIKSKTKFEADCINLGGGFGIWYNDEDPKLKLCDYTDYLESMINALKDKTQQLSLKNPYLIIEPGRSIIGEAGITLYTVGAIKEIEGIKKYVAVDGGMFDNPRYALYQSKYSVLLANRADEPCTEKVTIAGKCCESGDLIGEGMSIQEAAPGDIIAVCATGAYNYSMASNYNRVGKPAVVFVKDGSSKVVVKRETLDDIIRNDI